MTVEAMFGLILLASSAGLVLARFSRPTARVIFSKVAVVAPYNGVPTLSFRLANERHNQILEAQVAVTLVRDERTAEGEWMRRFYDLQLARQRSPIFAMTFTVMHPIDPASPLWSATASSLAVEAVEIVVTVTGLDETISQAVHARTSYLAHEVLWGHRFADVFTQTKDAHIGSGASISPRRRKDDSVQGPNRALGFGKELWEQVCAHLRCAYGAMVMGPEVGKSRVPLCAEDRAKIFSGNAKPLLRI